MNQNQSPSQSPFADRALRRFARIAVSISLAAAVSTMGCGRAGTPAEQVAGSKVSQPIQPTSGTDSSSANPKISANKTIELIIDYGYGVQKRFTALAWLDSMTVLDVLENARKTPHGITFQTHGEGETAILTKIDDLENEKGATDSRDWLYYVNDHMADKSCALCQVKPGDVILWKFARYE